jgi:hypothetical protein
MNKRIILGFFSILGTAILMGSQVLGNDSSTNQSSARVQNAPTSQSQVSPSTGEETIPALNDGLFGTPSDQKKESSSPGTESSAY